MGGAAFSEKDLGKTVSIKGDKVKLNGKVLPVRWDGGIKHHDCTGRIKSVVGSVKGKVELEGWQVFQNPIHGGGIAPNCAALVNMCDDGQIGHIILRYCIKTCGVCGALSGTAVARMVRRAVPAGPKTTVSPAAPVLTAMPATAAPTPPCDDDDAGARVALGGNELGDARKQLRREDPGSHMSIGIDMSGAKCADMAKQCSDAQIGHILHKYCTKSCGLCGSKELTASWTPLPTVAGDEIDAAKTAWTAPPTAMPLPSQRPTTAAPTVLPVQTAAPTTAVPTPPCVDDNAGVRVALGGNELGGVAPDCAALLGQCDNAQIGHILLQHCMKTCDVCDCERSPWSSSRSDAWVHRCTDAWAHGYMNASMMICMYH